MEQASLQQGPEIVKNGVLGRPQNIDISALF